jgi:hypothetical protein
MLAYCMSNAEVVLLDKDGLQPAASHAVLTAVVRRIQALALAG